MHSDEAPPRGYIHHRTSLELSPCFNTRANPGYELLCVPLAGDRILCVFNRRVFQQSKTQLTLTVSESVRH